MKRFLTLLLSAVLCAGMAACSAPGGASGSAAGGEKLIVGVDDSFPPMGFRDEQNNLVGFDIDLAKAVGDKLGVTMEFKPIDWSTKEMELANGRVDMIWNGLSVSPERAEAMLLSKSYLANSQVIVTLEDKGVKVKADLKGKKVGLQQGSTAEEALSKDPVSSEVGQTAQYADNVSALLDLQAGRIDAVVVDEVVARYYASKDGVAYQILDEALAPEEYAIAFKKGNTALHDQVMGAFDQVAADGTAAKISTEWFGEDKILK